MTEKTTTEMEPDVQTEQEPAVAKIEETVTEPHANGSIPQAKDGVDPEAEVAVNAEAVTDGTTTAEATTETEKGDAEVIEELRAQLAAAEKKSEELVDKLQRTAAEFQNSRRRQEKQLSDAIERAGSHAVERLFPIIDDLELAFGNLPEDLDESTSAWVDGFRQIHKKLLSLLEDQGVTAIPQDGEFDPNRHEAISSEPNEDVESGHIIATLRTGYEFKERVLRPALVRVAA